jgi:hypothetical protein
MSSRSARRRRTLTLLGVGFVVVVLLFIGFEVGIRQVPPDTVLVNAATAIEGHTFATREITDARIVADLYTRINDLPPAGLFALYHCRPPGPNTVTYSFRFTRRGLLIEVAALPETGCSVWQDIRGGIPEAHNDPNGQTQVILSEAHLP